MGKKNKLSTKEYEAELYKLQVELCKLQEWITDTGKRAIIVFEGRDAAGKGGVIKRITEQVSPRVFQVNALPAPSERQKTQMYLQRYIERFPAAGEIILFDRSWYNRAGVERVMGFCTDKEYQRFMRTAPGFERTIVDNGIILIKYASTGNSAPWTLKGRVSGMTIPGPRTPCSWPLTPHGRRGMWLTRTTKNAPALTVFHTCSASSPMRIFLTKSRCCFRVRAVMVTKRRTTNIITYRKSFRDFSRLGQE